MITTAGLVKNVFVRCLLLVVIEEMITLSADSALPDEPPLAPPPTLQHPPPLVSCL